ERGNTGVMSFMISHHGRLLEKDLGANGVAALEAMTTFEPDATWGIAKPTESSPAASGAGGAGGSAERHGARAGGGGGGRRGRGARRLHPVALNPAPARGSLPPGKGTRG